MKKTFIYSSLFAVIFFASCDNNKKEGATEAQNVDTTTQVTEAEKPNEITLSRCAESPEYADAMLELNSPNEGAKLKAGENQFNFNVKNFELGKSTPDAEQKNLANSGHGQHIHFILDNDPYSAHYEPNFKKKLSEGHHVMLAFLSRSYHESVKNPDAFVVRQFTVGNAESKKIDLNAPHMFYSRPKGTYKGNAETQKVLLDFYLINTNLSENGNKVRATINGKEFMITEWAPYCIEGLPMGESTIKLELLDASGNLVQSPYNPVERKVTLEKGDQPAS